MLTPSRPSTARSLYGSSRPTSARPWTASSTAGYKRLAAPGSATSRAAGESWAATYHRDCRDATRRRARADKVRDLQEGDRAAAARAAARAAETMREGVK